MQPRRTSIGPKIWWLIKSLLQRLRILTETELVISRASKVQFSIMMFLMHQFLEKLNDLRRIGVTTVWPTPLLATSKDEFEVSSIVDPLNVDPRFGEESDLKSLIEKAHDLSKYLLVY